jgi:hypothetical protein
MKFIAKLILTIIFIPVFLIFIFAVNLRFQFLLPSFWQNTFNANGTYSKLSVSISKNLISQTVASGGNAGDVKILTDLISADNLKDIIDRNINNFLQYANGKAAEIIVYLPVSKIPAALLSENFGNVSEQMSLTDFLKEFNISGISAAQIQFVSYLGIGSWIFLIVSTLLTVLLLYILYRSEEPGVRLIAPGTALVISGVIALLAGSIGTIVRTSWSEQLAGSSNIGDSFLGIIVPPVIQGVLGVWFSFAIAAVILGVILFFMKRPLYNKR